MRYDRPTDTAVVTAAELEAAIAAAGVPRSALSPRFAETPGPRALASETGEGADRATWMLETCATMLAAPVRVAELQVAVADESLRRLTVAWAADRPGEAAVVARRGGELLAAVRSVDTIAATLLAALGVDGVLLDAAVRAPLAARDVVVFAALADALRRARMRSELAHAAPPASVSADEVAAELASAEVEDFRWLLPLFEKTLPFAPSSLADTASVSASLQRIASAGLVALTGAGDGAPALASPAGDGALALDGLTHRVSAVAAAVAEAQGSSIASESVLLVRDASRLWVLDVTGDTGEVSSAGRGLLEGLVASLAGGPPPPEQAAATASGGFVCVSCGRPLSANARFCTGCGKAAG